MQREMFWPLGFLIYKDIIVEIPTKVAVAITAFLSFLEFISEPLL